MDDAVGRVRSAAQDVKIIKGAALHLRPGGGESLGRFIGAGQPHHLMAGADELGNDAGTDPTGRAGDEYTHDSDLRMSRPSLLAKRSDVSCCRHSIT